MRDLTALVDTRDCATAGCPYEADSDDGLCRHCRTRRPRTVPTAAELRAMFNDPQEEQRVAGYTGTVCKIDGCTAEPVSRHGMNAGLCDRHRDQAAAARRASRLAAGAAANARPAATPDPEPAPEPAEAPGSLAKLAAQVDTTRYELDQARERHQAAVANLREALDREAA